MGTGVNGSDTLTTAPTDVSSVNSSIDNTAVVELIITSFFDERGIDLRCPLFNFSPVLI